MPRHVSAKCELLDVLEMGLISILQAVLGKQTADSGEQKNNETLKIACFDDAHGCSGLYSWRI